VRSSLRFAKLRIISQFSTLFLLNCLFHEPKDIMLHVIRTLAELRNIVFQLKQKNKTIGLVPTMGNLHEGHLSLVRQAKADNDVCVVTIFVNPTQFNDVEDLKKYPRTEEQDISHLEHEACDFLFMPSAQEVYTDTPRLLFQFGNLESVLEGKYRNGHFSGVATIVSKLFHWVSPTIAYFGQKDLQQFRIIETLVKDLSFPLQLKMCPIVRENNGLAMSSRNNRLSTEEKTKAAHLHKALTTIKELMSTENIPVLINQAKAYLSTKNIDVEYLEVVDAYSLQVIDEYKKQKAVACIAAYIGKVRLIDNLFLNED